MAVGVVYSSWFCLGGVALIPNPAAEQLFILKPLPDIGEGYFSQVIVTLPNAPARERALHVVPQLPER